MPSYFIFKSDVITSGYIVESSVICSFGRWEGNARKELARPFKDLNHLKKYVSRPVESARMNRFL